MDKNNFSFVKKLQASQRVEPNIQLGETGLEAVQRMEKERMAQGSSVPPSDMPPPQQPQQPQQPRETIVFEGNRLSRDFFTALLLCIIKLNNTEVNKVLHAFGISDVKDLDGKPIVVRKKKKKKRRK